MARRGRLSKRGSRSLERSRRNKRPFDVPVGAALPCRKARCPQGMSNSRRGSTVTACRKQESQQARVRVQGGILASPCAAYRRQGAAWRAAGGSEVATASALCPASLVDPRKLTEEPRSSFCWPLRPSATELTCARASAVLLAATHSGKRHDNYKPAAAPRAAAPLPPAVAAADHRRCQWRDGRPSDGAPAPHGGEAAAAGGLAGPGARRGRGGAAVAGGRGR